MWVKRRHPQTDTFETTPTQIQTLIRDEYLVWMDVGVSHFKRRSIFTHTCTLSIFIDLSCVVELSISIYFDSDSVPNKHTNITHLLKQIFNLHSLRNCSSSRAVAQNTRLGKKFVRRVM